MYKILYILRPWQQRTPAEAGAKLNDGALGIRPQSYLTRNCYFGQNPVENFLGVPIVAFRNCVIWNSDESNYYEAEQNVLD